MSTITAFSEGMQNGGNTYRAALLEVAKREVEVLRAEADLQETTPRQKKAKEQQVNHCKAEVLRAQADTANVRIKKEQEELDRLSSYPATPVNHSMLTPLSRHGLTTQSTSSSMRSAISRFKTRKMKQGLSSFPRVSNHVSTPSTLSRTRVEMPFLELSNLSSPLIQAVSSGSGEAQSSPSQGSSWDQHSTPIRLHQTPKSERL